MAGGALSHTHTLSLTHSLSHSLSGRVLWREEHSLTLSLWQGAAGGALGSENVEALLALQHD
jgi:hypothetical protein